jgi:hypothetical protein
MKYIFKYQTNELPDESMISQNFLNQFTSGLDRRLIRILENKYKMEKWKEVQNTLIYLLYF